MFKSADQEPLGADPAASPTKDPPKTKRFYDSDGDSDSPDGKPPVSRPSRRNTGSRSRPSSSNVDVKTEASSTILPEDSVSAAAPLRRRRSQLSRDNYDDN
ncbi:hypothetical protein HWV62_6493 [Athelia sp. TMB]|nr:hypothetical protein HWV62_6493 [Athelia sp. TMB]